MQNRPRLMGILNVTPDSFSDGGVLYEGQKLQLKRAVNRALQMVEEGADIIDIGGESTGPGSKDVGLEEELERVIPVVKQLRMKNRFGKVLISVDTYKAEVARQALEAGADMINDVTALRGDPQTAQVLAKYKVPIILMYSKDSTARTTREKVQYDDVMKTVIEFLQERIDYAVSCGIVRERIIVDPGMGAFVSGNPKYSLEILRRLRELEIFKLPILVGASRKGFIGQVLGAMKNEELRMKHSRLNSQPLDFFDTVPLPLSERLEGSLACALVAARNGASILRVHDVQETRRMMDMIYQIAQ